ncbi:MAG: hypothetical protein RIC95_08550 [Vicingaceae bacterium]
MKVTILTILFTLFVAQLSAQSECNYFHRKNCAVEEGVSMKYDSQSKSAVMAKGQTSEFHMVAYNGLDYRISVCADELIGTEVQLKIFEKERVLIKPEELTEETAYEEDNISNEEEDSYADETYDEYNDDYSEESSYSDDDSYSDSYSDSYDDSYADAYTDDYSSGGQGSANSTSNQPKFKLVKELLYDNAENAYANTIEFTAEGSMSLILEITIPGESAGGKLKIREMGCVGVLIEHQKSKNTGF